MKYRKDEKIIASSTYTTYMHVYFNSYAYY